MMYIPVAVEHPLQCLVCFVPSLPWDLGKEYCDNEPLLSYTGLGPILSTPKHGCLQYSIFPHSGTADYSGLRQVYKLE